MTKQGTSRTGLVYHPSYLSHIAGPGHPECPERLESVMSHLGECGLLGRLQTIEPTEADIEWIETIHSHEHVERIRRSAESTVAFLDADTGISRDSYHVARLAVGGVLAAVDAVMHGMIDNAFAAVRPPGHHAERARAMGFCLFNNVAIAAAYLLRYHRLKRVLIVDWDVHHGNGTQAAFYDDPSVLYVSIHQYPHYPGTGGFKERGVGKGLGFTINIPLAAGSGGQEYFEAFESIVRPAAVRFLPEFVLISAGFDAHREDPLAGMELTEGGFAGMTQLLKGIAEKCCQGRIVSALEGGYHLSALARSVESHLRVLMGPPG
ncbi:histone deacetylase [candidate division TA06 bacterium DG_24]|uniref:Histone deacetylase n=3 Tax=Bacteria division TA06 TaxID=1156500 RepID=A0A0S8G365_UNCT6|nr:MAG: histone deacetylase [candidate division TA06 bacterium DG_24]KPK67280.1 MAG: histone deacetylase [candidate division TA06 bacterium SM23_40]